MAGRCFSQVLGLLAPELAETGFPWSVPGSVPQRGAGVRIWVNGMVTPAGAGTGVVGPGVGPGEVE